MSARPNYEEWIVEDFEGDCNEVYMAHSAADAIGQAEAQGWAGCTARPVTDAMRRDWQETEVTP